MLYLEGTETKTRESVAASELCKYKISRLNSKRSSDFLKGSFINYVKVLREGGIGKISTYSYFGVGGGQTHSYVIFSKSIFYFKNRAVWWFDSNKIIGYYLLKNKNL